jgi:hypothetical protein
MLPQHHNGKRTYPILDPMPNGQNKSPAASFQPPSDGAGGLAGSDILRLHRKGSKVWSEIRGKLMGKVGRNSHGNSGLCIAIFNLLLVRLIVGC